jgi:predicted TPR repeat methyltransferase
VSDTFKHYSAYYDLLYADKDYAGEAQYVRTLIDECALKPVASLIELGCGTGIHAGLLAAQGLKVLGVDSSAAMLATAQRRTCSPDTNPVQLSFELGDARSYRTARTFDVVASIFHVLSYQTSEADANAMLATAAAHLSKGGIFIFDFWYGPAVLWQRPAVRTKNLANDHLQITRLAEPVVRDEIDVVEVNYKVFIRDRNSGVTHEIQETHPMRYFFLPELDTMLAAQGMERVKTEEWMTRRSPSLETWGVCVVARKHA